MATDAEPRGASDSQASIRRMRLTGQRALAHRVRAISDRPSVSESDMVGGLLTNGV